MLYPGWVLTGSITIPRSTKITSTSKDGSTVHPGGEVSSTVASHRRHQVTRKRAKRVVQQRKQSPARRWTRKRNPTAMAVTCGHRGDMCEERRQDTKQSNKHPGVEHLLAHIYVGVYYSFVKLITAKCYVSKTKEEVSSHGSQAHKIGIMDNN